MVLGSSTFFLKSCLWALVCKQEEEGGGKEGCG
jgi:hypothetical protein